MRFEAVLDVAELLAESEVHTIERYFDQELTNNVTSFVSVLTVAEVRPRIQRLAYDFADAIIEFEAISASDLADKAVIYSEAGT